MRTESEEGVSGAEQHENAPHKVLGHDVVLDMVRVVLYAERQQLKDEG